MWDSTFFTNRSNDYFNWFLEKFTPLTASIYLDIFFKCRKISSCTVHWGGGISRAKNRFIAIYCPHIVHVWAVGGRHLHSFLLSVWLCLQNNTSTSWRSSSSFSEKATKIWKNLPLVLTLLSKNNGFVKTSGRFFSNFVAFSQCLDFTTEQCT